MALGNTNIVAHSNLGLVSWCPNQSVVLPLWQDFTMFIPVARFYWRYTVQTLQDEGINLLESTFYDMDTHQPPSACFVRLMSDFIWQDSPTPKISLKIVEFGSQRKTQSDIYIRKKLAWFRMTKVVRCNTCLLVALSSPVLRLSLFWLTVMS